MSPTAETRPLRNAFVALAALAFAHVSALGAERPPEVTRPRATSGDRIEPDWDQRLTITVGLAKADLVGSDQRVIQAAVDYVAALGGGTVKILPGTYRFRNAVYLRSKVRLVGSGDETVLRKESMVASKLAADSDWYDQEIALADATGFQLGDGVCLRTQNPHHGGTDYAKRTLVARSGNRFKLDRALRENFWLKGETTAATLFPLLSGENIADVTIENLALDGNKRQNDLLDGNHAGCIFCQDCSRLTMRGVTARNYHGDGISWQVCHDVLVENCCCQDNTGLGLHPGSGSQRPVIRGNRMSGNSIGLFFCWGVKFGLAEQNVIEDSGQVGISIGHRDTDNFIVRNTIRRSGTAGILFRPEQGKDFAGHRNRVEQNVIEDSGPENGAAIEVQGQTEQVSLIGNRFTETRGAKKRVGIRLGAQTREIRLEGNQFQGFAADVADMRSSAAAAVKAAK
jgi:hypothetical protein